MTVTIIITLCVLLLAAYVFDISSSKTRVPSVILLLLLGWVFKQLTIVFHINVPDLSSVLPVLGTVGLILIVLEGSLELEFNRSKIGVLRSSFIGALFSMLGLAFLLAFLFQYFGGYSLKDGLVNAIPFCVISSAIAIPSVRNLSNRNKEYVTYESSLSDIFGVIFFNFLVMNEIINLGSFGGFAWQLLVMVVISFVATISLSYLLSKINHPVKFIPIILLVILIYTVSKVYHLPSLIFILLFGLFMGNLDELKNIKWMQKFKPEMLDGEAKKFKELNSEAAFLIRALFFLLFGFLIDASEVLNPDTFLWAVAIVCLILVFRISQLRSSSLPLLPLLFIAPRGLITILLFLSIEPAHRISLVNNSLVIQVIILSAILMMAGLITNKK